MQRTTLPANIGRLRLLVLFSYYALLFLFLVNSILITTKIGVTTFVIWFIQIAPLIFFIPFLHRNHLRAYAWLSFVVLMYFTHGVLVAFDERRFVIGLVESILCVVMFLGLVGYIRKFRDYYNVPI